MGCGIIPARTGTPSKRYPDCKLVSSVVQQDPDGTPDIEVQHVMRFENLEPWLQTSRKHKPRAHAHGLLSLANTTGENRLLGSLEAK